MRENYRRIFSTALLHGQAFTVCRDRKWWNPMRYILGKRYIKYIPPRKIWIRQ